MNDVIQLVTATQSSLILDSTTAGRSMLTAADAKAQRNLLSLDARRAYLTADVTKSDAGVVALTGLDLTDLATGEIWAFEWHLFWTSTGAGVGISVDVIASGGSITASRHFAVTEGTGGSNSGLVTNLSGSVAITSGTAGHVSVTGTVEVASTTSLRIRIARGSASDSTTVVKYSRGRAWRLA